MALLGYNLSHKFTHLMMSTTILQSQQSMSSSMLMRK